MNSNLIISPGGRRYGRRKPLALPPHRMLTRTAPPPVTVVDLRKFDGPIKDQGQEGSCTGHAFSEAGETIYRIYPEWLPKGVTIPPIFSPQHFYEHELLLDGDFPNDNGSTGETACNVATSIGFCPLSLDPYVAGDIVQPTAEQDAAARAFMMGAWHGLTGSVTALSVLSDPVPWPVEIGFTVYESLESDAVAMTGIYNPQPGESVLGGHEVKMSGFDIGTTPTLRPVGCPPAVLIQNSWGTDWALSGYFWMAISVLDATDTDLKIIHAGRPW